MITGGAGALGMGLAKAFLQQGAQVVIADRGHELIDRALSILGEGASGVVLDLCDMSRLDAVVDEVVQASGKIDILINNAGYFDSAPLGQATEAQFDAIFAVNVKGLFFLTKAVAGQMRRQSLGGKIINIASEAGRRGERDNALYSASKAAVINLTQALALELIEHGINVNAISPGVIDTPMLRRAAAQAQTDTLPSLGFDVPIGRLSQPEDLAGCAIFLASGESDYIVGQTYNVDGGRCLN